MAGGKSGALARPPPLRHSAPRIMDPTRFLCELIAVPSVNPKCAPAGSPFAGEERLVEFLSARATRAGFGVERQAVSPGRVNLLIRLPPAGPVRHRLLLAPHLDTVGGAPHQFKPHTEGGRIHGRGACDTKGSLAAMWCALRAVARSADRPQATEIVLATMADEEVGQTGSRALARTGLKADLAIVGEPTRLRVVTAHKGTLWLRFATRGRAAHGARPELGSNAVHAMARVVNLLETRYAARLKARRHALLGHGTINVGTIQGGVQPNIVPDQCRMTADRRTLPGETARDVLREVRALLRRHGLRAAVADSKAVPCVPLDTPPGHPWVQALMRVARQTAPAGVDYFCDASVLAEGGIPSVVFGPGDIAQAHTADEWIAVRSLERAVRILERFLLGLP